MFILLQTMGTGLIKQINLFPMLSGNIHSHVMDFQTIIYKIQQKYKNNINQKDSVRMQKEKQGQQKQINISITKIYNWPQTDTGCYFDLIFYPQQIETPIIQKSVMGTNISNTISINALLKITYTQDEKIIILKIVKNKKDNKELLGEFQINLDVLRDKNVQYYPFGRDYVLQINHYTQSANTLRSNSRVSRYQGYQDSNYSYVSRNSRLGPQGRMIDQIRYLPEMERYYNYGSNPSGNLSNNNYMQRNRIQPSRIRSNQRFQGYNSIGYQNLSNYDGGRVKKSFSQKVFSLLQQVKSIKQDIMVGTNNETGFTNGSASARRQRQDYSNVINNNHQQRLKKSMSDGKFKSFGTGQSVSPAYTNRRNQPNLNKNLGNKTQPQKHRLILSTLNVVPCQQYYNNSKNENINNRSSKDNRNDNAYVNGNNQNTNIQQKQKKQVRNEQKMVRANADYYQSRFK